MDLRLFIEWWRAVKAERAARQVLCSNVSAERLMEILEQQREVLAQKRGEVAA